MRSDQEPAGFSALRKRQRDVVSRQQTLRFFSPEQIKHRLALKQWRALHHGIYLVRQGHCDYREWEFCSLLAAGFPADERVCLGGLAALRAWGLKRIEPVTIDVLVPRPRRARLPQPATLRRFATDIDPELLRLTRPPTTLPALSLVDAVEWARSEREAQLIITSCFRQKLVALADVLRFAPTRSKRWELLIATATDAAGGSHTLDEIGFVDICRGFQLPLPTRQFRYADDDGRTRFADALFEEWKVVAEINGVGHDDDVAQNLADAQRRIEWELKGFQFLVFPNLMIRSQQRLVAQRLRKALWDGGWRP